MGLRVIATATLLDATATATLSPPPGTATLTGPALFGDSPFGDAPFGGFFTTGTAALAENVASTATLAPPAT